MYYHTWLTFAILQKRMLVVQYLPLCGKSWLSSPALDYVNSGCHNKILYIGDFKKSAGRWWLMPVIRATQETEIRRIMV
jgi:hypothetical protein